jgi:molybdenum cofactor biosynthesis enzyme MoaA
VRLLDTFRRPLRNLRLSVIDRCDLCCQYCMPETDYLWLPREDVFRFEEMRALVDVFLALAVEKVRLTAASRYCAGTWRRWCGCSPKSRHSRTWC